MPGGDLTLVKVAPDEIWTFEVDGDRVVLVNELADNLWVLPG